MKIFKYILVSLFLFSCTPKDVDKQRYSNSDRDSRRDSTGDSRDQADYRSSTLRRLKVSSSPVVIQSFIDRRYSNPSYGYDGDNCEKRRSCKDICDESFFRRYRKKCYRAPAEFIENLETDLFKLISISDLDSVDISPAFIEAMLDFDDDLLLDLIRENMSEGDLKTFLAWVAVNENISIAFLNENSDNVLERAFKELNEFQSDSRREETSFNIGLIDENDTFLSLASDENNEEGFVLGYKVLEKICSNRDCKLDVLCARESESNSRSRIFGYSFRSNAFCKTSTRGSGRHSRNNSCYIHGSNVWSFLDELIDEEEIRDSDFDEDPITVAKCNNFCGEDRRSNTKCRRIL